MFCNVGALHQLQKGAAHECKAAVSCRAGPPEQLDPDDPLLDGDVGESLAMNNHKLLKAARIGNVQGIVTMLTKRAFLETRRPFVMTPESVSSPERCFMRGEGLTPLMCAAQGGYEDACRVLLRCKACVDVEDEDGMRPLHYAAAAGWPEICKILIDGGADPQAADDDGMRALEHVPPEDMMTSAEKKLWQGILGRQPADACRNDEPEVSPEPEACGNAGSTDLLGPDCTDPGAAEVSPEPEACGNAGSTDLLGPDCADPGADEAPCLPGQLERQPLLMD
jgi:hypothetical protein